MAQSTTTKGGKKGRKFGRNKDRSPSAKRYLATKRAVINKAVKIAKHKKQNATKTPAVPHGTARANRRGNPCNLFREHTT